MRRVAVFCALVQFGTLLVVLLPSPATAGFPPSEWVVGPRDNVALLTIEGRGGPKVVRKTLKVLDAKHAKATFFLSARWLSFHRKLAKRIVRSGHVLGNRGYGKTDFTSMTTTQVRSSISRATKILQSVHASPLPFLRPPRGRRGLGVLQVAGSMGYRSVRWTHHPVGGLADRVTKAVLGHLRPGSIVSLDIWRKSHRHALDDVIERIRKRDYVLRTVKVLRNVHAVRWDVTLRPGSSGSEVAYLDKALAATSYPVGKADSSFDYATLQAVYAFEKTHKLARDGVVTPAQMSLIAARPRPRPPKRPVKSFIDIDISRQVLFEVRKGRVFRTLPVSSGNEENYTVDGKTYKAHTPRGSFVIERKIPGWRVSRLGRLWYPSYFVGGYAIHGSTSVPTAPASHGCVRLPMYATRPFYNRTPIGMHVYVHN